MTQIELSQVVERVMNNAKIETCIACNLHSNQAVESHRKSGRMLTTEWWEHVDFWRCTVKTHSESSIMVAELDLHDNGTVRTVTSVPCQITVSKEDGFLCLSF